MARIQLIVGTALLHCTAGIQGLLGLLHLIDRDQDAGTQLTGLLGKMCLDLDVELSATRRLLDGLCDPSARLAGVEAGEIQKEFQRVHQWVLEILGALEGGGGGALPEPPELDAELLRKLRNNPGSGGPYPKPAQVSERDLKVLLSGLEPWGEVGDTVEVASLLDYVSNSLVDSGNPPVDTIDGALDGLIGSLLNSGRKAEVLDLVERALGSDLPEGVRPDLVWCAMVLHSMNETPRAIDILRSAIEREQSLPDGERNEHNIQYYREYLDDLEQ